MTRKKAIAQLISDFHNKMIAQEWEYMNDLDRDICKALKISPKTN
jgi:hypothetical protein